MLLVDAVPSWAVVGAALPPSFPRHHPMKNTTVPAITNVSACRPVATP